MEASGSESSVNSRRFFDRKFHGTKSRAPGNDQEIAKRPWLKSKRWQGRFLKEERESNFSRVQAALHSEVLLQEERGFLELDEGEDVTQITQSTIRNSVDLLSATKSFSLNLPRFGPYRLDYTRNGRHLVLGGRMGHLAVIDWTTKNLLCEINAMEEVFDVAWLHQHTMFAAAQKEWLYIYDNQGIELHCVRKIHHVLNMEFLPYHFLLATSSNRSYISWVDVSVGKLVSETNAHLGPLNVMTQNPSNAVIVLGHAKGTVTMWSPTVKEPLVTVLCHKAHAVRSVAVQAQGTYMATIATDNKLKLWDCRNTYRCLDSYRLPRCANHVTFNQAGDMAAVAMENLVHVYRDMCRSSIPEYLVTTTSSEPIKPYLVDNVGHTVRDVLFCPYEDVLGVAHARGFSSILVPGAGTPNFDALESNPFESKKQRREAEVKALLEKIQPEMIVLDPFRLNSIETKPSTPQTTVDQGQTKSEGDVKKKKSKRAKNEVLKKRILKDNEKRKSIQESMLLKTKKKSEEKPNKIHKKSKTSVLDRFKGKTT